MMLNELCAGDAPHHSLPLTDSRLRGDIRRMEDGDMGEGWTLEVAPVGVKKIFGII